MSALPITAIIKTFERPAKLRALLASIRKYYPTLAVVVVDDSQTALTGIADDHTTYLHTEYDIGVSAGRNLAVSHVQTPYTLLLDDDYVFTAQTRLGTFLQILQTTPFRLVAGEVLDYGTKRLVFRGTIEQQHQNLLFHQHQTRGTLAGHPVYDYVVQFFLAETELLRTCGWNPKLKTLDHEEFFWRMQPLGVPLTSTGKVKIVHNPDYKRSADDTGFHEKRRARVAHYRQLACTEMGVTDFRHIGSPYMGLSWLTSTLRLHAEERHQTSLFWRIVWHGIHAKRLLVGGRS